MEYIKNLDTINVNYNRIINKNAITGYSTPCFGIYKPNSDEQKNKVEDWELINFVEKLSSRKGVTATFSNRRDIQAEEFGKSRIIDIKDTNYDWSLKDCSFPKLSNNSESESFDIFQRRSKNFPTTQQKKIIKALSGIPVYTVVNGYNELVISTSRSEKEGNLVDWLHEKYYNIFKWNKDLGPIKLAPFFFNKEDAEMYMHEVFRQDPKHAEEIGVEVRAISLDSYYVMNRTSPPKLQARVIADLSEMELLCSKNLKSSRFSLHSKQAYGKNWFQGTPIYRLKLSTNDLVYKSTTPKKEVEIIFFKLSDVDEFWKKLRENQNGINNEKTIKNQFPVIQIYNLESYLLDVEATEDNVIFYCLGGDQTNHEQDSIYRDSGGLNLGSIKRFLKGVYWLLTSDVLPTEKNDW